MTKDNGNSIEASYTIQDLIQRHISGDKKIQNLLLERLKTDEPIWAVTCSYTKNYWLEFVGTVPSTLLFTEKRFFEDFQQKCKEQGIEVSCEENSAEERMRLLGDFYRSGFEGLIIDKGQPAVHLSLFALMKKPDFSKLPEIQRPVMNPSLVRAANQFFQLLNQKKATLEHQNNLFREIYNAQFLMAMDASDVDLEQKDSKSGKAIIKEGTSFALPTISNSENQHFYPVFTDWNELRKYDPEQKYNGMLVKLEDIKHFIQQSDGAVINPYGANIVLSEERIKEIEAVCEAE